MPGENATTATFEVTAEQNASLVWDADSGEMDQCVYVGEEGSNETYCDRGWVYDR